MHITLYPWKHADVLVYTFPDRFQGNLPIRYTKFYELRVVHDNKWDAEKKDQ